MYLEAWTLHWAVGAWGIWFLLHSCPSLLWGESCMPPDAGTLSWPLSVGPAQGRSPGGLAHSVGRAQGRVLGACLAQRPGYGVVVPPHVPLGSPHVVLTALGVRSACCAIPSGQASRSPQGSSPSAWPRLTTVQVRAPAPPWPAAFPGLPLNRCLLSTDSLGWKLFYVSGCLLVAVQNLEDWEVRLGRVGAGGNIPDGLPWAPLLRGPPPGSAS